MRSSRLTSFTAGALCMLVLGSGTAVAATGGKFILGRSNAASTVTGLTNSEGTALSLKAPSAKAPLAVSNGTKVARLNSDRIDGLDSGAFARVSGKTGTINQPGYALDADQNGLTDTILAEADCPAGTQATGGGFHDLTSSGIVIESEPLVTPYQGYLVAVSVDESVTEDPTNVASTAVCYNPTGAVAGAPSSQPARATVLSHFSTAKREAFAAKASARN